MKKFTLIERVPIKEEKGCGDCLRLKNTTLKGHITLDQTIAVSKGNYSTVGDLCL